MAVQREAKGGAKTAGVKTRAKTAPSDEANALSTKEIVLTTTITQTNQDPGESAGTGATGAVSAESGAASVPRETSALSAGSGKGAGEDGLAIIYTYDWPTVFASGNAWDIYWSAVFAASDAFRAFPALRGEQ